LRNYETLSLNGLSSIPAGATLIGAMAKAGAESPPRNTPSKMASYVSGKFVQIVPRSVVKFLADNYQVLDVFTQAVPISSIAWAAIKVVLDEKGSFGPSDVVKAMELAIGNIGFRELDQQGRLSREQKKAFAERIAMALFGGVSLIVPMLVMTLYPSRNTDLITTSTATFIFAIVLALGATSAAGKDVLAATAAYAAVLVVFVGTSVSAHG
jgi:hypothetical protein